MAEPTELPEWNTTEERTEEPNATQKSTGWVWTGTKFEKPKGETLNWWMNNVYKWILYLKNSINTTKTDEVKQWESDNSQLLAWSGGVYVDTDAIGGNPTAKIYPDGTIVGSTDNGNYIKYPNGDIKITGVTPSLNAGRTQGIHSVIQAFPIDLVSVNFSTVISLGVRNDGAYLETYQQIGFERRLNRTSTNSIKLFWYHSSESEDNEFLEYTIVGSWK